VKNVTYKNQKQSITDSKFALLDIFIPL